MMQETRLMLYHIMLNHMVLFFKVLLNHTNPWKPIFWIQGTSKRVIKERFQFRKSNAKTVFFLPYMVRESYKSWFQIDNKVLK